MSQNDRNFDEIAEKFQRKIYGGFKGKIRLKILQDDLSAAFPQLLLPALMSSATAKSAHDKSSLNILDAGGGTGQLSVRFAKCGHHIVLNDISAEMLKLAQVSYHKNGIPENRFQLLHQPIQNLPDKFNHQFDIVLLHAVLEWLAEPPRVLEYLDRYLKPGGVLSLMFYNKHSIIFRNLLHGNFRKLKTDNFSGEGRSLTPLNPLQPEDVYAWIDALGYSLIRKSGIRVFSDNMRPEIKKQRTETDLVEMEERYCRTEPYLSLARYIHVMYKKPDNPDNPDNQVILLV
jgi:S-adenosylmethionine-dependent methyltransferase